MRLPENIHSYCTFWHIISFSKAFGKPTSFKVTDPESLKFLPANSGEHSAMIDGKGLAGCIGCQCAGCTAAVSTSSRIAETGKKKSKGGMKERTREVEREAKRGHEERGEKKPSLPFFCPSGRPGVCSFVLSSTTQPGTADPEQVLLIVLSFPKDGHN